jgi:outer membrane protein assembly factor BamB|tara:strand:+ start:1273 stop:2565 length:1293 start_codon:yes stop_codon:yes gene_type:complete
MRFVVTNLLLLFLLSNCASNSDKKLNDRISVLSYSSDLLISTELDSKNIILSQAREVNYWSQSGQNPQNNLSHIYSDLKFENKKKILKDSNSATNTIQPIYFEGNLCNVSTKGFLRCLDINTEEILFEVDLKTEFEENYDIIRGGLAYFDDQIVLADGYGQVKVLSGIDGSIIWENNINLPILSAPIIYRGYIYFITLNNKIYAMDFTTGEVKWSFQTIFDDKKSLFTGVPAAIDNIIIAPFSNGEIIAFIYDTGSILWSENVSKVSSLSNFDIKDIAANPVISDDKIYTLSNNGRLVATNMINGSLAWSLEISGANSPSVSNMQLYVIDNESRLFCINKMSGEIYWITQLEENKNGKKSGKSNDWKGPYLINGLLYTLSTHGELLSISPITSEILSSKNIKITGISIDPVILSKNIFIIDNNSNIYKLD